MFKVFGVAGGIITLVTGASLASIFEIIYFLTVRFWEEGGKVRKLSSKAKYFITTLTCSFKVNEDKDTTFDLKETDYDDDYKGDIKSREYEEERAQKVETIQSSSSPSAPSPDSFGKVERFIFSIGPIIFSKTTHF